MVLLLAICAMVVLFSLLGLIWDFAGGLISSLDGLMLLVVCLIMGGVFGLLGVSLARQAGLLKPLPFLHRKRAAAEVTAHSPTGERK